MENNKNIEIGTHRPTSVVFGLDDEEIIKLSKEGFFYKGNLVENDHEVYERFVEWLNTARKIKDLD